MEETEAMATQFSSLEVADERITKLPEPIIHCILNLLPCIKDVMRSSVISKSWLQAWRTFPIPEFNLEDFVPSSSSLSSEEVEAKTKQFIKFVDSSLRRFRKQSRNGNGERMKSFNLSATNKMAYLITRWVGMALKNKVEHLAVCIINDRSVLPCLIPDRALSAYWLKSLILIGPTICFPFNEDSSVDLPSLTALHIQSSCIRDEHLQKLLSGCPALDCIHLLDCKLLSKVDIFNHPNLEILEVEARSTDLTAISVRAPKLESFGYTSYKHNAVVRIHNSPELKHLRISDRNKTDEWFNKFIAQFPLIESLTIDQCIALRKIRISNPHLEKIAISNCNNLEDVVISSKKLASFYLVTPQSSIPNPSIRMEMDNPLNDCTAHIVAPLKCDLLMEASWYRKLQEFLTRPFALKTLGIFVQAVSAVYGDMKAKDVHKKLPPASCNIEKLWLVVSAPSPCHSPILNGFLSACHPTTIELDGMSDKDFIKLVCEELGNRGNNRRCCCKDGFKCWKHQLKEVKIEKIKGIEMEEDLDWDGLFSRLPTLEAGNNIYFKLKW